MNYLVLFLLLVLQACSPFTGNNKNPDEAEVKIYEEWLYAFKLNDLVVNPEIITRPPGIEQRLFSLILPGENGLLFKTHCVYYQVPYKKIIGKIVIEELKKEESCPASSSDKPWLVIEDVSDLSVKLENYKLSLSFKSKKKMKERPVAWNFLLPNLEGGLIHEKYQPQTEKKLFPGMTFLKTNEETFDPVNNKSLGKLSDRLSRGSAIRCLQIDKNCNAVGEDRCGECRYGWFQVVDHDCPMGGSRFCGQNHCGEKQEPACVRGSKVVAIEDAGICQSDLGAVLNADHILVCQ